MSAETPGTETHHYWSASRNASQFIKPVRERGADIDGLCG